VAKKKFVDTLPQKPLISTITSFAARLDTIISEKEPQCSLSGFITCSSEISWVFDTHTKRHQ